MDKKRLIEVVMGLSLLCLTQTSIVAQAEIKTVPYVDLSRYVGDWYQISHIPMWFEGGNCSCARQRLTPSASGDSVDVFNSCNDGGPNGNLRTISGKAFVDDKQTNAKLTVDFNLPFKGTYWIIGLDAQYRYAVVTDEGGGSLYILSKTPRLSDALFKEALATAARQLDTSKLVLTEQKGCRYPN